MPNPQCSCNGHDADATGNAQPKTSPCPSCSHQPSMLKRVGLWNMIMLWWGKLRRAVMGRLFRGYIKRRHALRRGECKRCGTCCTLGIVCPSLQMDEQGLSGCAKYGGYRQPNCCDFPTTESDLKDVQRVRPGHQCGFHFDH